jgi:pilus assembly protein CpaB
LIIVAVGVGAGILLIGQLNAKAAAAQQPVEPEKSPVVVLTHDMSLGEKLSANDVSISEIPVDVIPRDAVTSLDSVIGKFIKSDMVQGEMVLQNNIADPTNNNQDLSFILSEDHVLMAFPAIDLISQENVIQRGDVIDILATVRETIEQPGSSTTTTTDSSTAQIVTATPVVRDFTIDAFQKVSVTALVLNTVNNQNGSNSGKTSISSYLLALKPQDALVLKHLVDQGAKFDIVLRAPTSTTQFDLTPVTEEYITELYGLQVLP